MHILLSAHTVYPHFIGGRERHVHGLARGLARRHRVTVLGGASPGNHGQRKIHGYTLVTLPMISVKASSVPLQIYRIIPGFTRALRRLDPDLVHAFEYGSFTTDLAAVYCAREGIPLLLTVYGYQFQRGVLFHDTIVEFGTVLQEQPDADTWYEVPIHGIFLEPIVVMGPLSYNGTNAATARVKDVTQSSFKWSIQEWLVHDVWHM